MSKPKHQKPSKPKHPIHSNKLRLTIFITIFATVSVFGISFITGNQQQSGVGNSSASAIEPADINNDNTVNVLDLSYMLGKWKTTDTLADLNQDGLVNVLDLSRLLAKWGPVSVGPSQKPGSTNTGVPAGQTLTIPITNTALGISVATNGNVTISKSGTFSNMLVKGRLYIKASNVTVKYSKIEGSPSPYDLPETPLSEAECLAIPKPYPSTAAVLATDGYPGVVIEDSEVVIAKENVFTDGIRGHNMTIRRVKIAGGIDGVGVYKNGAANTVIQDSWIYNMNVEPFSPFHGCDEPTHSDGIQVHYGSNIRILRNNIEAKTSTGTRVNAAIMVNENGGFVTSDLWFNDNWADYGQCSVNVYKGVSTGGISNIQVNNNKFGKNQRVIVNGQPCAMMVDIATKANVTNQFTGNVWEDGSQPPPAVVGNTN
jgi:hypothetical protein